LRDFAAALRWHQIAANILDGNIEAGDRLLGNEWTEPYFPLHAGDRETIKNSMLFLRWRRRKRLFTLCWPSIMLCLKIFGAANKEFATAMKLQPIPEHRRLIQNRMESVENMAQMPDDSKAWLISHRIALN